MTLDTQRVAAGGQFLLEEVPPENIATREDVTEEQLMVRDLCEDFVERELMPVYDRLEAGEEGLMPSMLKKAGEIGLLSVHVPTAYGGEGLDNTTAMLVGEVFGRLPSWSNRIRLRARERHRALVRPLVVTARRRRVLRPLGDGPDFVHRMP